LALEIDPDLWPVLEAQFKDWERVRWVGGDAMKLDLEHLVRESGWAAPYKIVANLPYSISTPLLTRLMTQVQGWETAVLMVQKEIGEKLAAGPGESLYGPLSLTRAIFGGVETLIPVPSHWFTPRPAVESVVVRLTRRIKPLKTDINLLRGVIRKAFEQRRKTLANALKSLSLPGMTLGWPEALEAAGIAPGRRGETVSLEEYMALIQVIQPRAH
jgi:16S rRNA (adenine1518-N6/adenine1519-N6)-dimethyltransferase